MVAYFVAVSRDLPCALGILESPLSRNEKSAGDARRSERVDQIRKAIGFAAGVEGERDSVLATEASRDFWPCGHGLPGPGEEEHENSESPNPGE